MSAEELKQLGIDGPKPAKYHSEKMVLDGITFDSKKEANYYASLLLEKRAGLIDTLELQPEFILQEAYVKDGKKIRAIVYRADFKIVYASGRTVVVDVKGHRTKEYLLKKKMLLFRYPNIDFREI